MHLCCTRSRAVFFYYEQLAARCHLKGEIIAGFVLVGAGLQEVCLVMAGGGQHRHFRAARPGAVFLDDEQIVIGGQGKLKTAVGFMLRRAGLQQERLIIVLGGQNAQFGAASAGLVFLYAHQVPVFGQRKLEIVAGLMQRRAGLQQERLIIVGGRQHRHFRGTGAGGIFFDGQHIQIGRQQKLKIGSSLMQRRAGLQHKFLIPVCGGQNGNFGGLRAGMAFFDGKKIQIGG